MPQVLKVPTDDDLSIERGDPVNPHGLLVGIGNDKSLQVFDESGS